MPFIRSSDGVRLAYRIEGAGPALLLHLGAGCDAELWRVAGIVEPLAGSYTCVLFDHRGHGESDTPRGPSAYHVDRLTADVVELLDQLDIGQAAFWGYSMGISTGVRLAEQHSDRVWALIGSGAVGPPEPADELAAWIRTTVAEFRAHGWEKLIERFDAQEPKPVAEWMKQRIRATDVDQYLDTLQSIPDWSGWEEWNVLPTLTTPTLFVTGELEDPDDHVGQIVAQMANGERARLVQLGHINAFLAADEVIPRVTAFLATHQPSACTVGHLGPP